MKPLFQSILPEFSSHLAVMENSLLQLEHNRSDQHWLAFHQQLFALSGYAQFFELTHVRQTVEQLQLLLSNLRSEQRALTPELTDQLLQLIANIKELLEAIVTDWEDAEAPMPKHAGVRYFAVNIAPTLKELSAASPSPTTAPAPTTVDPTPAPATVDPTPAPPAAPPQAVVSLADKITWPPGLKSDFMAESEERVARLETVLLELETNPERIDGNLDAMFRELHSLKGNSSTLLSMLPNDPTLRELHALAPFKTLVHDIESFVATHRDSRQPFSPTEIEALFRALDHIRKLLLSISKDESSALDINAVIRSLSAEPEEAPPKKPAAPSTLLSADVRAFLNTAEQCLVAFTKVAELAEEQRDESQLKKFRRTAKTFQKACAKFVFPKMEEVAERVLVLAENNTLPAEATLRPSLEKIADLIEFLKSGGEREKDSTPPEETTRLTAEPNAAKAEAPPPAQPPPDKETKRESAAPVYVRVPQTRVDRMMNLVGELLVSKHSFRALGEELNRDYELSVVSGKVLQAGSIVGRIADDLRAEMMEIRMVPLDLLFSRFPRMIRDLSKSTGKPMKLAIVGSDVRMDKTIVEQLNDPLVHLLRNCGDHGIESPEKRAAAGKPAEGIVTVSAMRQGQRVIVTVEDDGQGLNIERLRSKALEKSIVHEAELERMTPKEIQELIFRPGFSTATEVTDISGRGVGMDAVRQALSEIGAGLNLESKPGHGTRFLLSIPLTLAVSQGLMIEAAGAHFILPLEAVEEIVKAPRSSIRHFGPHQHFFEHRGEVLPVTSLRNTLAYDQGTAADTESCRLLVIDTVNQRYALEVDRVLHEMEMLVKPLEGKLHQIPGISGTTISGDGSIIIVLNPAELFDEIAA